MKEKNEKKKGGVIPVQGELQKMELKSRFVFAEESCQFGRSYKRKRHRMLSYHVSSNSLCGSLVKKMATVNLMYECITVVLTSQNKYTIYLGVMKIYCWSDAGNIGVLVYYRESFSVPSGCVSY